jgi:ABC-2 type transport system ATP-binding protein
MKQRLAIAASLLSDPEVLVLDEPTNGLDPEGIADIRHTITQVAGAGTTVLLASHLLDEVQKVCSHVAVLRAGEVMYTGRVDGLVQDAGEIEISAGNSDTLSKALHTFAGILSVETEHELYIVKLKEGYTTSALSAHLIKEGVDIAHFARRKGSLEKEFLALLQSAPRP